jgi:hypothetical protein
MKHCVIAFVCFLCAASILKAEDSSEAIPDFTTERMSVNSESIYVVSSFDVIDYFSTYNHEGEFVWETPFSSKIVSWKIKGDVLFIFSRHRNGLVYYLTRLEAGTGTIKWEKSIFSPVLNSLSGGEEGGP